MKKNFFCNVQIRLIIIVFFFRNKFYFINFIEDNNFEVEFFC